MAPMRPSPSCRFSLLGLFLATMLLLLALSPSARATGLFKVRHKFLRRRSAIADLLAHDSRRHSRILAVADLALGGIGVPTDTGLYYTEIGLGTPPKKFFVQVDTGSNILWVNCATCTHCPEKSDPGFDLTLYNPNTSVSRSFVSCQDNFCVSTHGDIPGCAADYPCRYKVIYGDGSSTAGFFVTDALQFPQVSNDHQTKLVNANVTFGPHYNVNLKAIEVGGAILPLPSILFDTGDGKGAIIDSGTTLSYVPEIVYKSLMRTIFSKHPNMTFYKNQGYQCFPYPGSVDTDFPEVVFHFENSLLLNVYPHDYLFQYGANVYCVGWQSGGTKSKEGKNMFLLDLVLSNKLVVYDLENQVIGWTNYNCSSSIKVQDGKSGAIYTVDAHNLSPSGGLQLQIPFALPLFFVAFVYNLIY